MIAAMLMLVFLALVSLGLWLLSRVLLTAAAADAARWVANADVPATAATERVHQALAGGPLESVRDTLRCEATGEGLLVTVTCTADSPGFASFLDGVLPALTVTGHSVEEGVR